MVHFSFFSLLLEQSAEIGFIKGIARFMKIGPYHIILFLILLLFAQNFDNRNIFCNNIKKLYQFKKNVI